MLQQQLIATRAIDALWGGALADAIGNRLEFIPRVTRKDFDRQLRQPLYITDDTQMTLFVWDALLDGKSPKVAICSWYRTQLGLFGGTDIGKGSKLHRFHELNRKEAPGTTCMSSAYSLLMGYPVKNDSKGNGTVMRASPYAFYGAMKGLPEDEAKALAAADAILTHKHPYAAASSELLVSILHGMLHGLSLENAVLAAECSETAVDELVKSMLPSAGESAWTAMRKRRCGWVAEEALALAVGAAARGTDFLNVVFLACNGHDCDSDTVASIAGQLASQFMPAPSLFPLEAGKAIHHVADRILRKAGAL